MSRFITPRAPRLEWADLIKASTPYATAHVHLFTNDITPTEDTTEVDLTEATFGGYTDQAITWGTPFIDGAGLVHMPGDNNFFLCSGTPFENLYGYYVLGAGGEFLGAARFDDAPRSIPAAGYGTDVVPEVIV